MHRTSDLPVPAPYALSVSLHREWDRLRRRPSAVARARSWHVTELPFADLDELLALAGFETRWTEDTDRVLHRLLDAASTDELAGRIVLQRLLPGLLAAVRRRSANQPTGCDGVLEELVGGAWIAIRTYGRHHRPSCLAAALIDNSLHHAFKKDERRRRVDERPTDPVTMSTFSLMSAVRTTSPCEDLARVIAEAKAAGVDDADLVFVRQLLEHDQADLANRLRVTTRTIRNRRDRVAERLRQAASAA